MKSFFISEIKEALSDLKECSTLLAEIRKTEGGLSKSALSQISSDAFNAAEKYGGKAAGYLNAFRQASRAGYEDAKGIAELSLAAQNAGSMTAELAEQYISAADRAYQLGGSVSKLAEILDGASAVSRSNSLDMAELAQGMSSASRLAASLGLGADETTAALAAMMAATGQGGAKAAESLKSILTGIREISSTGSPMDVLKDLKDLSETYSGLAPGDTGMDNLLESIGGTQNTDALNAFLKNYGMYEKMLQEYADGAGSMAAEAELAADSWEGSLNRLSNTWTETIGNIATPETVTLVADSLNGILSVINKITDTVGPLGSIGLLSGLFASFKDVGRDKTYSLGC